MGKLGRKLKRSQQFSYSLQLLLGVKYLFMETGGRYLKEEHSYTGEMARSYDCILFLQRT